MSRRAARGRPGAPLWLMGMTYALFGMYGGVLVITVPQLLNARHVPEETISSMTAVMISPGFWTFLISPVLDVRFSRRWYAVVSAVICAGLLSLALANLDHLVLVEALLVTGFFFANLYQGALGGWLASIITTEEKNTLSVWATIANISGGGAIAVVAGELAQHLSLKACALSLGAIVLLPILVFPWMPAAGPDRRLAEESFQQFFTEVVRVLRQRDVQIAIALFVAPAATFSLVNLIAGLGSDFHASSHFVGLVGGVGVLLAGFAGSLLFPVIATLLPLRSLYLAVGAVGSCFTLMLLLLPRTPTTFAVALIGENAFQSLAITVSTAISFDTVGRRNPLAATTYCLMISSFNIANTYMLVVDGWGYTWRGVAGSYIVDAGLSLSAIVLLIATLGWMGRIKQRAASLQ
jgi:MFS transporter, PAT family, beta-lactamase induction signal transducer AmpG